MTNSVYFFIFILLYTSLLIDYTSGLKLAALEPFQCGLLSVVIIQQICCISYYYRTIQILVIIETLILINIILFGK